ncbi:MAG: hypothetical protein SGARI_000731, partial [Bacillariaceae sp.]
DAAHDVPVSMQRSRGGDKKWPIIPHGEHKKVVKCLKDNEEGTNNPPRFKLTLTMPDGSRRVTPFKSLRYKEDATFGLVHHEDPNMNYIPTGVAAHTKVMLGMAKASKFMESMNNGDVPTHQAVVATTLLTNFGHELQYRLETLCQRGCLEQGLATLLAIEAVEAKADAALLTGKKNTAAIEKNTAAIEGIVKVLEELKNNGMDVSH